MKAIFITLLFFALPLFSIGQHQKVSGFFDKYSGQDGFTTVAIHPKLFEMFASLDTENGEMMEMAKSLENIQVLVFEDKDKTGKASLYFNEINSLLPENYYEELVTVRDGNDRVRIMVREGSEPGIIRELMIIVASPEEFVFVNITGNINLEKMKDLKGMNLNGFQHFDKVRSR